MSLLGDIIGHIRAWFSVSNPVSVGVGDMGTLGEQVSTIGNVAIFRDGSGRLSFVAGLAVDADGSPHAYGPSNKGLDWTANAGGPGNWWGVKVGSDGQPLLNDEGFYISTTALSSGGLPIDSEKVPYISVPPELRNLGASLGSLCLVSYQGRQAWAVVADIGPRGKVGEGSIYLAQELGINPSPRNGGTSSGVSYAVYPGRRPGGYAAADIDAAGQGVA